MVVLPFLFAFLFAYDVIFSIPIMIILIAPFYFYCYLIKHTVDNWIREYEKNEFRKEQKREKDRWITEKNG